MAMTLVVGSAILPHPRPPLFHPAIPLLLLLAPVLAASLIPLRRRWPIEIMIICAGIYAATALTGQLSVGAGIAVVITAFGMADRTTRRAAFWAGGSVATVVAVLSVTVAELGVIDPRVFQIAAGITVATALGDSSRSRREYLVAATERAERAEQTRDAEAHRRVAEERLRIAQDLHDTVAHRISVISLNAGVASSALDDRPEKAREALGTIRTASRAVLAEIGELLRYLRGNESSTATLPPQIGLQRLAALIDSIEAAGMHVDLHVEGDLTAVTGLADLVAFRIIQEGLTNAHKHGTGRSAAVTIAVETSSLRITVINPVPQETSHRPEVPGEQFGLLGLQERVASVRGVFATRTTGSQFQLQAELPLVRESVT